ncbi:thiopurine S-methyltransferase [Legionella jordanis]|uniref:Thiopurine S-methyltransferase n=1 Tax=Legionella jordanis TaxID=456 RepID=A0A0W0VD58_9GAMM|nr:thiopurine S-methyltransferase [Legionella jordanis]KTD18055.1 thiopurine S-methyltransferase [Legionella jordanis]RMX02260.1 thiopurine S-methyltransferase [Legionella jordanis]RMX21255.1 thiopurine S-methyltransferase [Legionella jordanis]VEH13853.1 thiopurine S-methyltransferase [Legionella jordanis]
MNRAKEFWLSIWQEGRTPFHREEVNPDLIEFWPSLKLTPHARVLVPLCGKSLDMLWLVDQGFHVTGIELSETAVQQFAKENQLEFSKRSVHGFDLYCTSAIEIWLADVFDLGLMDVPPVDAIYDRAALIALPEKVRPSYVEHCLQWLRPGGAILLKSMSYQGSMEGPPYSVEHSEIKTLYQQASQLSCLKATKQSLRGEDALKVRGLDEYIDSVWLIHY